MGCSYCQCRWRKSHADRQARTVTLKKDAENDALTKQVEELQKMVSKGQECFAFKRMY